MSYSILLPFVLCPLIAPVKPEAEKLILQPIVQEQKEEPQYSKAEIDQMVEQTRGLIKLALNGVAAKKAKGQLAFALVIEDLDYDKDFSDKFQIIVGSLVNYLEKCGYQVTGTLDPVTSEVDHMVHHRVIVLIEWKMEI